MSQVLQSFSHGPARGSPPRPTTAPALGGRRLAVLPVMSGSRSLSWMSRGACRHADPELFFPISAVTGPVARQAEAAKAVCGPCTVRAICLSYALEAMPEGIWGGTTPDECRAVRRRPFRRHASTRSRGPVSTAMTGESANATRAGHAAGQSAPPARTA